MGQSLTRLIPEQLRAAHLVGFRRYLETNQRHTSWHLLELPGCHKDGSEVPLEISFGEFRSGSRRWFTGVIRDVSDRRRAQETLREARELIQTVFNTVPLAIWGIDLLGRVTFWNHTAESMFGWTEVEVRGQDLPVIPEGQRDEYEQWLSQYATGYRHVAIERKRLRKDGSSMDCEIWTAPLRSGVGGITGTIGVLADITERKQYQRALIEDERKFRKLFADNPQPMWVFDVETLRFVEVNAAAIAHYGYTRDEFLSMSVADIRLAEDMPAFLATLHSGADLQNAGEWRHVLKDGRIVTMQIAAHRMDLFGRGAILSLLQDVTDRKRAEEEVKKYVRQLARTNADLEQFAWAASHDLQEPIRMVITYTERFERRFSPLVPQEEKKALEVARDAALKIEMLVEGLRKYWQIQHHTLELKVLSLASALQMAITRIQPHLPAEASITWNDLPAIEADEDLIVQLFCHLIDNAVKFRSKAPARIYVSALETGQYWSISFQDNGMGFAQDYAERIFLIFQRLSRTSPGVGVGLSLCKQIMERHEGRISVTSQLGVGTTIYLEFPRRTKT